MNATRLLCFLLLICGQGCNHPVTSSVEDKDLQCDKLVNQMIIAQKDFVVALNAVRDLETAKGSAETIRECAARLDAISEEFGRLGPMSPALKARLLERLDLVDREESAMARGNVRVLSPDEANIIAPAADTFFEKWGAVTMKSGLYYTSAEYRKSRAQPDGAANGSQPIRSDTNRTSSAAGSRR